MNMRVNCNCHSVDGVNSFCEVEPIESQKIRVIWCSFLWLQFAVEHDNYLHPNIIYITSQNGNVWSKKQTQIVEAIRGKH